jgi:hypothetical protein
LSFGQETFVAPTMIYLKLQKFYITRKARVLLAIRIEGFI